MFNDIKIHHRRSIRLPEYDYSQSGIYFVTICCYQKQRYFGEINGKRMSLSTIGQMAKTCWLEIPKHFSNVKLNEFIIMPNHMHGLIQIDDYVENVGAQHVVPLRDKTLKSQNKFQHIIPRSLGVIIRGYKSTVTNSCRVNNLANIIWQRNYYERIIRNDDELNRVREYIKNNPVNWQTDRNNIKI